MTTSRDGGLQEEPANHSGTTCEMTMRQSAERHEVT
jgi:hypothetical protein